MKKLRLLLIVFVFLNSSCASSTNPTNSIATPEPDFGLRIFSYSMFPDKKYIVLKEHNDIVIANSILSSYNTNDLINALSLAYLQLTAHEQAYVNNAFHNTTTLPYKFQEALVIAVTTGDELHQDPTLNSLKNLLIVTYGNMTQEEVQSRYYYGLTKMQQQVFQQRWNNFTQWYNEQENMKREEQLRQQQEQQAQSNSSGGFWKTLGVIVLGVLAGYSTYRASTYNSNVNSQLNWIQMQNTQLQGQVNTIQRDLRRLAY